MPDIKATHYWYATKDQIVYCKLTLSNLIQTTTEVLSEPSLEIGQWVIVDYDNRRYLGVISEFKSEEIRVNCLENFGSNCYRFPIREDNIFYKKQSIIRLVNPPIPNDTGSRQYYTLEPNFFN